MPKLFYIIYFTRTGARVILRRSAKHYVIEGFVSSKVLGNKVK